MEYNRPLMAIFLFVLIHWYLAGFSQSFFLHRYASHGMFRLNRFWERFFYAMTFVTQGASYLNPRAYALLHRLHHAHSDTDKDPHSPVFFPTPLAMMWNTLKVYLEIFSGSRKVEKRFEGNYPTWAWLDRWADHNLTRLAWIAFYIGFYALFATSWWMFLFLPIHIIMGPIHGAIVNWCGHRYGYANFDNKDHSKNTLAIDFLCVGELMQNNHHRDGHKLNFASKWFEIDPTYVLIKGLKLFGIVQVSRKASS